MAGETKKWLVVTSHQWLFAAMTSKTMNISGVTAHDECIQKFIKCFETNVKYKELLDGALEIPEFKAFDLVSWCKTRLEHFLKVEAIFDDMLRAVYDLIFTQNIKPNKRDVLITLKIII